MSAFLVAGFFAVGFLVAGAFFSAAAALGAVLVAGFLAAVAFGVAAFLAGVSFTPASLAIFARRLLRRATVFFLRRFFFTAVSSSLCAALNASLVGLARNAFVASLMSRLIPTLRSRRTTVCFIRLIADLMIGMVFLYLLKVIDTIKA